MHWSSLVQRLHKDTRTERERERERECSSVRNECITKKERVRIVACCSALLAVWPSTGSMTAKCLRMVEGAIGAAAAAAATAIVCLLTCLRPLFHSSPLSFSRPSWSLIVRSFVRDHRTRNCVWRVHLGTRVLPYNVGIYIETHARQTSEPRSILYRAICRCTIFGFPLTNEFRAFHYPCTAKHHSRSLLYFLSFSGTFTSITVRFCQRQVCPFVANEPVRHELVGSRSFSFVQKLFVYYLYTKLTRRRDESR